MDSRRRYKGGLHNKQVQGRRISHNNRNPPPGIWQPAVPLWEKQFCSSVGCVPWEKLVESKRYYNHIYGSVAEWNDSACEEAFHNAKNRYFAKINGLHCDIALPDPDIYIDNIDWNSEVDPELILDLERGPEEEVGYSVSGVIVNISILVENKSRGCTGWEIKSNSPGLVIATGWRDGLVIPTGWGDEGDTGLVPATGNGGCIENVVGDDKNSWEESCAPYNGTRKEDERRWNYYDKKKREGRGNWYKTTRFYGEENQMDGGRRSYRRSRWTESSNIACT